MEVSAGSSDSNQHSPAFNLNRITAKRFRDWFAQWFPVAHIEFALM